jgi:transposase-like protein
MGPHDGRDGGMSLPVGAARTAEREERFMKELPGWAVWAIGHWDGRITFSAMPAGAATSVITDQPAEDLVRVVRRYETELGEHLADARAARDRQPDTGWGRDQRAVLARLVAALEAMEAGES